MYYTYLVGWSQYKKYYYGVRFCKNASPQDLWVTYFTSSKEVTKFRQLHGEPDIIQIRKEFKSKETAIDWEAKVLKRLKVHLNEQWLNKGYFSAHWHRSHDFPVNKGKIMNTEQRKKISKTRKEKGLGKKSAQYLPLNFGDKNIMKNQEFIKQYKQRITGRKLLIREDGTRYWSYENVGLYQDKCL